MMEQIKKENESLAFLKDLYVKNLETSSSMKEALYASLKEGILSNQLKTEITENQISKLLGISRTPVREAMQVLQTDGLLAISAGKKAKVLGLSQKDASDISLVLQTLHILATGLFIDNASAEDYQKIEEDIALASFYCDRKDPHNMAAQLTKFHVDIAVGSGNRWLADTVTRLLSFAAPAREYVLSRPGRLPNSLHEHMAILDAIKKHDKLAAKKLLVHHVESAFTSTKNS